VRRQSLISESYRSHTVTTSVNELLLELVTLSQPLHLTG